MQDEGYFTYGNSNNIYINDRFDFDRDLDLLDHQMWDSNIGGQKVKEILDELQTKNWDSRKENYMEAIKKHGKAATSFIETGQSVILEKIGDNTV